MPANPFAPVQEALKLPKLDHLPVHLPEAELSRSARGRGLQDYMKDPESPRANAIKVTAVERNVISVRERSSFQLRDGCFIPDTKPPPLSPSGRAVTRSQLMELRRTQFANDNIATWQGPVERSTTLPRGVQLGAPGRSPRSNGILGRQRFSHLDTSMVRRASKPPACPPARLPACPPASACLVCLLSDAQRGTLVPSRWQGQKYWWGQLVG